MIISKLIYSAVFSQFNFLLSFIGYKLFDTGSFIERFNLENDIEVVCIQNNNFEQSALTLIVDAGSIYDPKSHEGLSHLIEHLIVTAKSECTEFKTIISYVYSLFGDFEGTTAKEFVKFGVKISDARITEIADMLAHSIVDSSFDKIKCEKEIEIIEQEFIRRKSFEKFKLSLMLYSKFDPKYPENKFNGGNRSTLKHDDISEKVNGFIKDYYTGNRMKLVIASKMNLFKLKEIANLFSIIPKGKIKNEITSVMENDKNILFNDKYEIQTLNVPLQSVEYSPENIGSIITFHSKIFKDKTLFISILVPGKFSFFEHRFDSYLSYAFNIDWDNLTKPFFKDLAVPYQNISFTIANGKRLTTILFEIDLKNNDENQVKSALQQLHNFFHLLQPNESIFNYFKHTMEDNFAVPKNEAEMTNLYGDLLRFNIKKDFLSYLKSLSFDSEVFKSFFDYLANIKNWCAFQVTKDLTNLTEKDRFFSIKHSKPIKIELENNYTEDNLKKMNLLKFFKNFKPSIISYASSIEKEPLIKKIMKNPKIKIDKNQDIIYKEFDYGEYTAINQNFEKENELKIKIEFFANIPYNGNVKQEILNSIYLKISVENTSDLYKNCVISVENNVVTFCSENSEELLHSVKKFKSFLDKPIEGEKIGALNEYLSKNYINFLTKTTDERIFIIFNFIVKTDNFLISYDQKHKYPASYYVDITAYGKNSENYAESCYMVIKSSDKAKMKMLKSGKTFKSEISDVREERFRFFAIDLGKNLNGNAFCMGLILKTIYSGKVFEIFRVDNQLTYNQEVNVKIVKDNVFLIILINSISNDEEIQKALKNEFIKYQETIKAITDDHLDSIKKAKWNEIDKLFKKIHSIEDLISFAKAFGIYSFDCEEILKKKLISISKLDLLQLSLEKYDPIIINEDKKDRNE